jgi:predicted transcriptional regulator
MSRKPFDPSEAGDTESKSDRQVPKEPSADRDRPKMTDILALPEVEQELVTWMVRQTEVSLAEAVAYLNQEEQAVSTMLNSLFEQGFVQQLNVEGELRYRTHLAPKQRSRTSHNLWQELDF